MLIHCNGGQELLPWLLSKFSTGLLQKWQTEHLTTPVNEHGLFLLRVGAFERRWLINLKSFHMDRWTAVDRRCFTSFLSPIFLLCPKYAWPVFSFWNTSLFLLLGSTSVLLLLYTIGLCYLLWQFDTKHCSSHFSVLPYTGFSVMLPFTIPGRHFRFTHILSSLTQLL